MWQDPVTTNPDHYVVIMENDQVRVLEYTDTPGDVTTQHDHPESVMYTLSSFRRRLHANDSFRDLGIVAGGAHWLPAQQGAQRDAVWAVITLDGVASWRANNPHYW